MYLILGNARSGTTVINESLMFHPEIHSAKEILHPFCHPCLKSFSPYSFIACPHSLEYTGINNKFFNYLINCDVKINSEFGYCEECNEFHDQFLVMDIELFFNNFLAEFNGFKLLYNQIKSDSKIWTFLNKKCKIIHIIRNNFLEMMVSLAIAVKTNKWQRGVGESEIKHDSFYVNNYIAELYFNETKKNISLFSESIKNNQVKIIFYDDIKNNWNNVISEIEDFLEIEKIKLAPTFEKFNTNRINEIILNYDDVKKYFKNTEWSDFFN